MKKIAYYHLYAPDNYVWVNPFLEQMWQESNHGLLEKLSEFNLTIVSNENDFHIAYKLMNYIFPKNVKFHIDWYQKKNTDFQLNHMDDSSNMIYESVTLKKLWIRTQRESSFAALYFHSKGITGIERMISKNKDYDVFVNTLHWRKLMEWAVIENHEKCLEELKTNDTVGVNWTDWPMPHYSGNYWWANSDYLRKLSDPEDKEWMNSYRTRHPILMDPHTTDRMFSELWIGSSNNSKMKSLYDHPKKPPESNLAETIILKKEYYK